MLRQLACKQAQDQRGLVVRRLSGLCGLCETREPTVQDGMLLIVCCIGWVAQICCVGGLGGVALRPADRSIGCASLGNLAYTDAAIEGVQDQRRELLHCLCMTDACPASRSRRDLDPNWTLRTVLSSAILWHSETRKSLSSLHHCIFCPLLSNMVCLIAPQALIMPAVVRRPQHVFKAGRLHLAVRIKSFSPQRLHRRSVEGVAAQNRQPDAVTPHRINRSGATAARAKHLPPDHCEVDKSVDSRSSFMDLHSCWRRLADGAAALTAIMALVRCHASHILIAVKTHGSFTYPAVRSVAYCFDSPH